MKEGNKTYPYKCIEIVISPFDRKILHTSTILVVLMRSDVTFADAREVGSDTVSFDWVDAVAVLAKFFEECFTTSWIAVMTWGIFFFFPDLFDWIVHRVNNVIDAGAGWVG